MHDGPVVSVVVLAAGAGRRFGGTKLLAELDGTPLLRHVLQRIALAGLPLPVVVAPPGGALERALAAEAAVTVVNPDPEQGLSSSLRIGWTAGLAREPRPAAILVVLGDQPRVSVDVLRRLAAASLDATRPIVAPRYRGGGGSNPVRIETSASALVESTSGDRGLGPLLVRRPELVRWVEVEGTNPDVDTRGDLARLQAGGSPQP